MRSGIRDSVSAKHCLNRDDVTKEGDYWINRTDPERPMMLIMLPGNTIPSYLRLYQVPASPQGRQPSESCWTLIGLDNCPTLEPAIVCPGVWCGRLIAGLLVEEEMVLKRI